MAEIKVPFITEPTGLGDAVKKVTAVVGIRPCGGCAKRAEMLNKAVTLVPAKPKADAENDVS